MSTFYRTYGAGTGADIYVPIIKSGSNDFVSGSEWVPASGDVKISIDGASSTNITVLPTPIDGVKTWKFTFTDAELSGKMISVSVITGSVIENQYFNIETVDHQDSMHPNSVIRRETAASITSGTITLDTGASTVDNEYNGSIILIVSATSGSGQTNYIKDYNGTTKVATLEYEWNLTPTGTIVYVIAPYYKIQEVMSDMVVEGTVTFRQSQQLSNAAAAGIVSGAEGTNIMIRDFADSKDRITATVDQYGNRTAVTASFD